ncbi:type II toxin-antitoxin system RelE family toxin [Pueribacillus theae]|nr:type II toxin-antitoxin system RelE/ParE family toxin [Pueribacillus theae]
MPRFHVKLRKPASKYYEKLPPKLKNKVKEVINKLSENPYAIANVKPLEGSDHDDYRIRIGSLRLLYRIHNDELIIIVLDIGPRGDIINKNQQKKTNLPFGFLRTGRFCLYKSAIGCRCSITRSLSFL